jgi:energy-coupling factor transporter transmembrane protein EcfT
MSNLYKRVSLMAKLALITSILSIVLLTFAILISHLCHNDVGVIMVLSLVLLLIGFVTALCSLIVCIIRLRKIKGIGISIVSLLLSGLFILLISFGILISRVHRLREKSETGLHNLYILREAIIDYANQNEGHLPDASSWCDDLMTYNKNLGISDFQHPIPERYNLNGMCHFAFNEALSSKRLSDIPGGTVLLFEANGDWNLSGGPEMLETRRSENGYIEIISVDGKVSDYWYYKDAIRKFNKDGNMYYEKPRWQP